MGYLYDTLYGDSGEGPTVGATVLTSTRRVAPVAPSYSSTAGGSGVSPGGFNVDVTDPAGSMGQNVVEARDFIDGLKVGLFGVSGEDIYGKHGGVVGDIPVLGAGGRFLSETVGNILTPVRQVAQAGLGAVGGAFERISPGTDEAAIKREFDTIPADFPGKKEAETQIAEDQGLLGTGWFSADQHVMSSLIRQYRESLRSENPDLYAGITSPSGSLADAFTNVLSLFTEVGSRTTGRLAAGWGGPLGGENRLQQIMRLGEEKAAQLSPVELIVYKNYRSGEWSETQALDFLSAHHTAWGRDALTEIAGEVLGDPLTWAAVAASGGAVVGGKFMQAVRTLDAMETELNAARAAGNAERVMEVSEAINTFSKSRILSNPVLHTAGQAYRDILYDTTIGKMAKAGRYVIDPFHAVKLRNPLHRQTVDIMSRATVQRGIDAFGSVAHTEMTEALQSISPSLADKINIRLADAVLNLGGRRTVAQKSILDAMVQGDEVLQAMIDATTPEMRLAEESSIRTADNFLDAVHKNIADHLIRDWDSISRVSLAERLTKLFPSEMTAEDWLLAFKAWRNNPMKLSMLHAASFGEAWARVRALQAEFAGRASGTFGPDMLRRITLISKQTLTRIGADGSLRRLKEAADDAEKIAEIREMHRLYPELRIYRIDMSDVARTIEDFQRGLRRKMPYLPEQIEEAELGQMDTEWQQLQADLYGAYTLGFRPPDNLLNAVERGPRGLLRPIGDPWLDWVSDTGIKVTGTHAIPTNVRGIPILGAAVEKTANVIDHLEAMARVAMAHTRGDVIEAAARSRFTALAKSRHGMTEVEAGEILSHLDTAVNKPGSLIVTPRGLTAAQMWDVAGALIPARLRPGVGFTKRDLVRLVLDAYEGDLRFVGLQQKFTGRVKAMLGPSMGNYPAYIAENLYPTFKFRLNAVYQTQEKLEPWVLLGGRGAIPAQGPRSLNASDRLVLAVSKRMQETSLISAADVEMAEYAARAQIGHDLTLAFSDKTTPLGKAQNLLRDLPDVQGTKRINLLRTWKHQMGRGMKEIYETHAPGLWEKWRVEAIIRQGGKAVSDDDLAMGILAERMLGQDTIDALRLGKDHLVELRKAIQSAEWAKPAYTGEIKKLQMDDIAEILQMPTAQGGVATTEEAMRRGLVDGAFSLDDLAESLHVLGADADYVRRVQHALTFSWPKFTDNLIQFYSLTPEQANRIERVLVNMASVRGVTPTEYFSQIFAPTIGHGTEALVGALGDVVGLARDADGLARLAAEEGSTFEDLVHQLAKVFSAHLDPSAKRALLMEFRPELRDAVVRGDLRLDLRELSQAWDNLADTQFGDAVIGYMRGPRPPNTVEAYRAAHPGHPRSYAEVLLNGDDPEDLRIIHFNISQSVGDGVAEIERTHPEQAQHLLAMMDSLQRQLPDVAFYGFDIVDLGALGYTDVSGLTVGFETGRTYILFDSSRFGEERAARYAASKASNEAFQEIRRGELYEYGGAWVTKASNRGVPYVLGHEIDSTVHHEMGHVVDEYIRGGVHVGEEPWMDAHDAYLRFVDNFHQTEAAHQLSEYATTIPEDAGRLGSTVPESAEGIGELFSATFNPRWDRSAFPPALRTACDQYESLLADLGYYKSMIYTADNPDVARAAQMFGKLMTDVFGDVLERPAGSRYAALMDEIGAIPTGSAVPYNSTEAQLWGVVTDSVQTKWDDAYRLQYYARSRTMLERSINHPIFGLYPASYMWGKLLPEIIRFVAQEPFGLRTGAMMYTLNDVRLAVQAQREFDPKFDKLVEDLGHSQVIWALDYLMPATPWNIPAGVPLWSRSLATQGLATQERVQAGKKAEGISLGSVLEGAYKPMNPLRQVEQVGRVVSELQTLAAPVPATGLAAPLQNSMEDLQTLFSR